MSTSKENSRLTTPDAEKESQLESFRPTDYPANDIAALGPAPEGGLQAWINATGGFCIFFCKCTSTLWVLTIY